MAVLKDLIVHGNSRFLNGAKFNTINAESIGAEEGIFNKLIATTLDAKTATINDLTAQNATVVGLLDVQGELHTNAWTNANIANIGGSFYISPTVEPTDGTTTISITRNSATSWTVSASGTFATDFIKSGTATSGVAWPANSLVLITGDVVVGDMVYPLGTLKGTLSAQVTATAASTSKTITITGVTDAQNNNAPSVLQELYEVNNNANISNATFKKGKISLYKLGSNPIGILLSSMGTNSNSIIDIYGGVKTDPTVRIGHLAGLPNVNGSAPTGWGIYTDNGYFSGVIVSTSGKIGGFTIGSTDIHNGKTSRTETTNNGVWVGTDGIGLGKGITYFSNDGTGKIGPWTLSTTYLRNGNIASATNTSVAGVYLGTDGLNISNGTAATTSYITKTAVNIGNKLTWNGTTLTIDGSASIGGTTASTIVNNAADGAAAKTGLDNLEIGGRNLLINTNDLTKWSKESNITVTWDSTNKMYKVVSTGTSSRWGIYQDLDIQPNTTYTFSVNGMKSSDTVTASAVGTFAGSLSWPGTNSSTYTTNNTRSTVTFTSGADHVKCRVYLYLNPTSDNSKTGYFYQPKLEIGNKATDWSPAPEDLDVHKYVTEIDSNGIWVTPSGKKPTNTSTGAGATGTRLNGDGLQVYKAGVQVASYGTDATIGQVAANLYNVFVDADSGIALRKNTTSLLTINSSQIDINNSSGNVITRVNGSGLTIYNGSGTAATNQLAFFGSTATIGASNSTHTNVDSAGMRIYASNGTTLIAHLGYGVGSNETQTATEAPFFTFGNRITESTTYDTSKAYIPGDVVINTYDNQQWYYVCIHHTTGTWKENYWLRTAEKPAINPQLRGNYSVAEGNLTIAASSYSHAEGCRTTAISMYAHSEGYGTVASENTSHAEGFLSVASENASHAEGSSTIASQISAHAEGGNTIASGPYSHAEGYYTIASNSSAHAEGEYTRAQAWASHSQNYYTVATEQYQTAIGKYNKVTRSGSGTEASPYTYSGAGNYAFIIGNGTGDATANRSNALTIDWNGGIQMYLDSNGTSSANATSGTDKDLFNAIRTLGWYSAVIS